MSFLDALRRTFAILVIKNRAHKSEKCVFVRTVKTLIFLLFFMLFGGLGSPMELQMDAWGAYGRHFCPKVGDSGILFVHFLCRFDLWVDFWGQNAPCASVKVGRGERSAAKAEPSGGGGGKPPELLQVSYQQFSTPCYLCRGAANLKALPCRRPLYKKLWNL